MDLTTLVGGGERIKKRWEEQCHIRAFPVVLGFKKPGVMRGSDGGGVI